MSSLQMPKVDNSIMTNRDKIISEVKKIVNPDNVLSHIDEIKPYETDALAAYKQIPLLVVLPETVEEVKHLDLLLVSPFELVAELPTIPPAYPVSA